jgi:hypothetical protein
LRSGVLVLCLLDLVTRSVQRILGLGERRCSLIAARLGLLELSLGLSGGATSSRLGLASGFEAFGPLPVRRPGRWLPFSG